jgi:hypothetical protein
MLSFRALKARLAAFLASVNPPVAAKRGTDTDTVVTNVRRHVRRSGKTAIFRLAAFLSLVDLPVPAKRRVGTNTKIAELTGRTLDPRFPALLARIDPAVAAPFPSNAETPITELPKGTGKARLSTLFPRISFTVSAEGGGQGLLLSQENQAGKKYKEKSKKGKDLLFHQRAVCFSYYRLLLSKVKSVTPAENHG